MASSHRGCEKEVTTAKITTMNKNAADSDNDDELDQSSQSGGTVSVQSSVTSESSNEDHHHHRERSSSPPSVDYGYGDAAPDSAAVVVDYGYGDASPDSAAVAVDYGYGDAAPTDKYGYGDAAPDSAAPAVDYGYGDAAPDSSDPYGYGDAAPAAARFDRPMRRSSMKASGAPRRASIGYTGEKEVVLPGKKKVKRRTSISFDEGVQVRTVDPVPSLVNNDIKDIWFQDEEYHKIAKRSVALMELVEKHGVDGFDGKKPCVRGLEALSSAGQQEKYVLRNDAWDTVLMEQYMQRETGTFMDDEAIAKMYKLSTLRSKMEASRRAKEDEKEIEQYTRDTRRFCRRLSM